MYVIKYDKVSMIRFIQCIEKYPAVYNNKNLFSKDDVEKAWEDVALAVGEKGRVSYIGIAVDVWISSLNVF